MRVISGIYRSRLLKGFDVDGIRPTMDKVKESMFAMINSDLDNSICLDLFAGTGSLGIEALSNGGKHVYFVDNSNNSLKVLKENISQLKIEDKTSIISDNYLNAIKKFNNESLKFDIIFLDPPYGAIKISKILNYIIEFDILRENGKIVCEYEEENLLDKYNNLELLKYKKYGKTHVKIYINRK